MASRFGASNLHQRDSRSALFENYNGGGGGGPGRSSPSASNGGYGVGNGGGSNGGYGYPSRSNGGSQLVPDDARRQGGFRPATPNRRGQYSDAVLNELESQNDQQVEGILGKVRMLKDITVAMGDEIRDSSALADKLNDRFDNTRLKLRGTMNRMLVMAERTGVGWKVWVGFFAAVWMLFIWVWLF